jgi:hypothetical protein
MLTMSYRSRLISAGLRAFDHDEIVLGTQPIERTGDHGPELGGSVVISAHRKRAARVEDDDLRCPVALRFQRSGFMSTVTGSPAAAACIACAADLSAVVGDRCIADMFCALNGDAVSTRRNSAERSDDVDFPVDEVPRTMRTRPLPAVFVCSVTRAITASRVKPEPAAGRVRRGRCVREQSKA